MRFLADLALSVALANTHNFSRAAAALGMPASTLSTNRCARARIRFHLIRRSTRLFKLTDAVRACYEQSKSMIAEAMRIREIGGLLNPPQSAVCRCQERPF